MHIAVVANGDFSITPAIRACFLNADVVLACDNGAHFCDKYRRLPDLVLGDLDSLDSALRAKLQQAGVPFDIYPADKAMTDLEIALHHAASLKPRVVTLLAALGGRWDQSLANLLLLSHPALRHMPMVVRAATSSVIFIQPGWRYDWDAPAATVFSLLPITPLTGVTLKGSQYTLTNASLAVGSTLPVSNTMQASQASVQVTQGMGWLVVNAAAPRFYFERLDKSGDPDRISDLNDTFSAA